ncbi:hypothetical protein EDB19DRAFT_1728981 [Suillus lakei]|nr:hypothetical protein EDB19DRAFT_1728981 [Suillus lakei]
MIASAAILVLLATLALGTACGDRHACCQSCNDEEEGEMHDLCEVIRALRRGILTDISEVNTACLYTLKKRCENGISIGLADWLLLDGRTSQRMM